MITLAHSEVKVGIKHTFFHPFSMGDFFVMKKEAYKYAMPLLSQKMKDGCRVSPQRSLVEIQSYAANSLSHLHKSYKRQINPHIYKVSLSRKLRDLKMNLILKVRGAE